jgi:hypothetical protein
MLTMKSGHKGQSMEKKFINTTERLSGNRAWQNPRLIR